MTRIGFEAKLRLTVKGPLLVHSSDMGPWGVDALAMRTFDNHLLIPGDQIQGKTREAMEAIGSEFASWSGKRNPLPAKVVDAQDVAKKDASQTASDNAEAETNALSKVDNLNRDALRYPLYFSDFLSNEVYALRDSGTLTHVAMDPETGATKKGHLRVIDCPIPPGQPADFEGVVRFLCDDQEQAGKILERIMTAMHWAMAFGADKSIGFGRVQSVECIDRKVNLFERPDTRADLSGDQAFLVDFRFIDPLCFPEGLANGNIYETRDEVPGEALRGAVSGLLNRLAGEDKPSPDFAAATQSDNFPYRDLCRWLPRVRISIARPVDHSEEKTRPNVIPISTAIAKGKVFDFAMLSEVDEAGLFDGDAATFCPDWKGDQWYAIIKHFHVARPEKELRVHTAIDSTKRRASEGQLFALRSLRTENMAWRSIVTIDDRPKDGQSTPNADECSATLSQLFALLETGWLSVSRTRARATGSIVKTFPQARQVASLELGEDNIFIIVLRGPTLMLSPLQVVNTDGCLKSMKDIDEAYAAYWQEVSGQCLQEIPERRFKLDSLIGGFQARRYRYDPDAAKGLISETDLTQRVKTQKKLPYNPTLVVNPGSVFVLKVVNDKLDAASKIVSEWLNHGLPLPKWARTAYGDTHHTNIFLPQNGYGEIDVNLPCHQHNSWNNPLLEMPQ